MRTALVVAIFFFISLAFAFISSEMTARYYDRLGITNIQDKNNYYSYVSGNCDICADSLLLKAIISPLTVLNFKDFTFVLDFLILFVPALSLYWFSKSVFAGLGWFLSLASIFLFSFGLYSQFLIVLLFIFYISSQPKSIYVNLALIFLAAFIHQYGVPLLVLAMVSMDYLPRITKNKEGAITLLKLSAKALLILGVMFISGYSLLSANRILQLFHPALIILKTYSLSSFQSLFLFIFWTAPVCLWLTRKDSRADIGQLILLNVILICGLASLLFLHEIDFWRIVILIDIIGLSVLATSGPKSVVSTELYWLGLMQATWIIGAIAFLLSNG